MAAQSAPKRRRIQPVPIEDNEAAAPQLPAATLVTEAPAREVPPPAPGRRIWVSLDETYDHSWRKILAERGIKVAGASKRAKAPVAAQPEGRRDLTAMLAADRGNPMQQAIARIQQRIQHVQALAARGRADSDSDMADGGDGDASDDDGDGGDGGEGDGDDEGDDDKEDGKDAEKGEVAVEEEEGGEGAPPRAQRNAYDVLDDFIDDSEFIEAVEKRDERKTKFQGFFVNAGTVERVGERPTKAPRRRRRAPDGDAAPAAARQSGGTEAAPSASAPSAATQRTSAAERPARPPAASGVATGASSVVQAAMQAAAAGAAAQSTAAVAATPAQRASTAAAATPAQQQPSPPAAATPAAAPAVDMDAHRKRMLELPVTIPPDVLQGLPKWDISEKLRGRIVRLRDVAARTVPFEPKSKKKTPPEIMDALEAIVRPFYMESEAGPNTNKCKKAIWTLLFPILAPWVAETTTKTKVQNINSRLCGSLELDKDKLRSVARACAEPAQLNDAAVVNAVGELINKLAKVEACESLDGPEAEERVWEQACRIWREAAAGTEVSPSVLKSLHQRHTPNTVASVWS